MAITIAITTVMPLRFQLWTPYAGKPKAFELGSQSLEDSKRLIVKGGRMPCSYLYKASCNVRDKRAQQTSERNTFHFPTTIILNYTTIILGNNYN